MVVVVVGGQLGELGGDLRDVVYSQVGRGYYYIFVYQQRVLQFVRVVFVGYVLYGDAVGVGRYVEFFDEGFSFVVQREVQARFFVYQYVVVVYRFLFRGYCRGFLVYNDIFGKLFDKGDFFRVRYDVFFNVINVYVQRFRVIVGYVGVCLSGGVEVKDVFFFYVEVGMVDEILILFIFQCICQSRFVVLDKIYKVGGYQIFLFIQEFVCWV